MTKFNVGDKVRYIDGDWFEEGEILYVLAYDGNDHMPYSLGYRPTDSPDSPASLWVDEGEFELVEESTDEIEELTRRDSELEAKVKRLEFDRRTVELLDDPVKFALTYAEGREDKSANERRKEAIEKAKKFVEETVKRAKFGAVDYGWEGNYTYRIRPTTPDFVVNEDKRTVVALIKGTLSGKLYDKGIAKCAPSDVFNVHIGKAIALGRAYGLDVSEFEQAPQPTEPVLGMVVEVEGIFHPYVDPVISGSHYRNGIDALREYPERLVRIISDSEAQY